MIDSETVERLKEAYRWLDLAGKSSDRQDWFLGAAKGTIERIPYKGADASVPDIDARTDMLDKARRYVARARTSPFPRPWLSLAGDALGAAIGCKPDQFVAFEILGGYEGLWRLYNSDPPELPDAPAEVKLIALKLRIAAQYVESVHINSRPMPGASAEQIRQREQENAALIQKARRWLPPGIADAEVFLQSPTPITDFSLARQYTEEARTASQPQLWIAKAMRLLENMGLEPRDPSAWLLAGMTAQEALTLHARDIFHTPSAPVEGGPG